MVRLWVDFGDVRDCHTWTLLKFAELAPEEEAVVGEWAELWDHEGNTCYGIITRIEGQTIHLRLDWSTWMPAARIPDLVISGLISEGPHLKSAEPVTDDMLLEVS
jgi:hypothetical protein